MVGGQLVRTDVIVRLMTAGAAALGEAWHATHRALGGGDGADGRGGAGGDSASLGPVTREPLDDELLRRFEPQLALIPAEAATGLLTKPADQARWWRWWACRATCCKPTQ